MLGEAAREHELARAADASSPHAGHGAAVAVGAAIAGPQDHLAPFDRVPQDMGGPQAVRALWAGYLGRVDAEQPYMHAAEPQPRMPRLMSATTVSPSMTRVTMAG